MNAADWIAMTGHPMVGRGGRPINPKLLPHLVTKARPKQSTASALRTRKRILATAQATLSYDAAVAAPQRRTVRDASILEQSMPDAAGAAAQMRHWAAVQRARSR